MPSIDDLYLASKWLEVYEGAEDADACHRVAKWLLWKSDEKELQEAARHHKVPVKLLRDRMKKFEI